jgi:hypothetical protein
MRMSRTRLTNDFKGTLIVCGIISIPCFLIGRAYDDSIVFEWFWYGMGFFMWAIIIKVYFFPVESGNSKESN